MAVRVVAGLGRPLLRFSIGVVSLVVLTLGGAGVQVAQSAAAIGSGAERVVPGAVVSQGFGCTEFELEPVDPSCPGGHFHPGVDLAAPAGSPVLAPTAGVAWSGSQPACGNFVQLDHPDGASTLYCHLAAAQVGSGAQVPAGFQIGLVGSTGNSTGPHVHLEVRSAGHLVDPLSWLGTTEPINP